LDILLEFKGYEEDRLDILVLKVKNCTRIQADTEFVDWSIDFNLKRTIEDHVAKAIPNIVEKLGYTEELQMPEDMKDALEKIHILSVAEIHRKLSKYALIESKEGKAEVVA